MTLRLEALGSLTSKFSPADVELLAHRQLQKRLDQKYILPMCQMSTLLEVLVDDFKIVPTSNHEIASYETQYFDTQDHLFYTSHLRGKRPRYKVRLRRYPDRNLCMLECKRKNASDLTVKTRTEVPYDTTSLTSHHAFFTELPCSVERLETSLFNTFHRITLLHKTLEERLTIDFNIGFNIDDKQIHLDNCTIVERKRSPVSTGSPVPQLLRLVQAYPLSISKYCIGGYHLFNTNKSTLYRAKSRMLRKVLHDRTI